MKSSPPASISTSTLEQPIDVNFRRDEVRLLTFRADQHFQSFNRALRQADAFVDRAGCDGRPQDVRTVAVASRRYRRRRPFPIGSSPKLVREESRDRPSPTLGSSGTAHRQSRNDRCAARGHVRQLGCSWSICCNERPCQNDRDHARDRQDRFRAAALWTDARRLVRFCCCCSSSIPMNTFGNDIKGMKTAGFLADSVPGAVRGHLVGEHIARGRNRRQDSADGAFQTGQPAGLYPG